MIIGRLLRSRGTRPFYQVAPAGRLARARRGAVHPIQSVGGNCVAMRS